MIWLVRVALSRPYTFVVLALAILIVGPLAALTMPTDIFPAIRIPVIGVAWQFTGLSPDQMAGRIITPYERVLTTTVDNIEHSESTSFPGIGIVKIYFQPDVDIRTATAQVTSISQTLLKQLPAGITPPLILNYDASTVPVIQVTTSGVGLIRTEDSGSDAEFHAPSADHHSRHCDTLLLWRQGAADSDRSESAGAAGEGIVGAGCRRGFGQSEPGSARRHGQNRRLTNIT